MRWGEGALVAIVRSRLSTGAINYTSWVMAVYVAVHRVGAGMMSATQYERFYSHRAWVYFVS